MASRRPELDAAPVASGRPELLDAHSRIVRVLADTVLHTGIRL